MDLEGVLLLGKYKIEKKIGEGGMGYVYRALDISTHTPVAVKILKEDLSLKDTYLRRFQREIRSGSLLNHPAIVRLIDEGEYMGKPFLVMEYVEGVNLRRWARNKRRSIPLILEKFIKICEGIDSAHRKGIIHRDLKPENVLITYSGDVKIMDFGLARKVQESSMITSPGTFIGTVVYTSPEQASGKTIDTRCDIYAIGVMLFEMLTGRLPFKGDDPIAVLFQHIHNPPPRSREFNKDITPALDEFIYTCMAKSPADRPQTAMEMALILKEILKEYNFVSKKAPSSQIKLEASVKKPKPTKIPPILKSSQMNLGDVEVSFVLLELTDFLAYTEDIDYPTLQRFLDEYNHRLESVFLKFGGKVVQMGGHKAFCVFRSFDYEDFALKAVLASQEIQRSIQALRQSGIPKIFVRIPLNIGVETSVIPSNVVTDENISKIVSRGKFYHTGTLILKQAKALRGSSILICGTTYEKIKEKVKAVPYKKFYVRGRMEPVFVYSVEW